MPEVQKTVLHKKKNFLTWPLTDGLKLEDDYTVIIKNKLKMLLATMFNERGGNLFYGTGLWTHVFSQFTDAELMQVETDVSRAVRTWLPEIEIKEIGADVADLDSNQITISIYYSLPSFNDEEDVLIIGV